MEAKIENFEDRLGKCYELSGRYVIDHGGVTLVHGRITDKFCTGLTIDHAWIEENENVYDPVLDTEFPKFLYYELFNAEARNAYSQTKACVHMLRTEHFGPWDEEEGE